MKHLVAILQIVISSAFALLAAGNALRSFAKDIPEVGLMCIALTVIAGIMVGISVRELKKHRNPHDYRTTT